MKLAAAAAVVAALVLGLALSGVFAREPAPATQDRIRLSGGVEAVTPSPTPTGRSRDSERVEMRVEEHDLHDDKGGLRDRTEDDNSGRGSGDDPEDRSDNSGSGSDNSGSDRSGGDD